jgi:sulfonate transport system ATP-binding protein
MHRLVTQLWQRHRPAVLMVTHDVDEALALADRVLVLAGGRIAAEHTPSSARPRRAEEQADLRVRVLSDLGVNDYEAA